MSDLKALFIPTYFDGLPRDAGSARIRAEWVARYLPGAAVLDRSAGLAGYDAYVFQKCYLTGQPRQWIRTVARWRDAGRCLLAFDLCDPDFLSEEHRRRLLGVLPLFDFAVASTEPIRQWLAQWLPAYTIPDRVDLAEVAAVRQPSETRRPSLVWAGYARNADALGSLLPAVEALGLELHTLTVDRPLPFAEFWARVREYDVLLNPRPAEGPLSYKSDNKTLVAWAHGLPVARTAEELERLCDPVERAREAAVRRLEVCEKWDATQSAQQWRLLLHNWRAAWAPRPDGGGERE